MYSAVLKRNKQSQKIMDVKIYIYDLLAFQIVLMKWFFRLDFESIPALKEKLMSIEKMKNAKSKFMRTQIKVCFFYVEQKE